MKKKTILILTVLICLFLYITVSAAPEDVKLIPLSKWNHKNVDAWGLYAKNGEYSWLGMILYNPGSSDLTISLPIDVDVAHDSQHQIVNTLYKKMINGSTDFMYKGFKSVYFNESFTLQKNSTYAVFFDITNLEKYTSQWDIDTFFSLLISDKNSTYSLPVKGVLIYDSKNETPSKLTIVNPGVEPLTVSGFCRDYTASDKKVTFSYTIKNNSSVGILVELPSTLAAEGLSKTASIRYTDCVSAGSSCRSRISAGRITLKSKETAVFTGEAVLSAKPAKTDFYVRSALRYNYSGKTLIPLSIGSASSSCSVQPTATPTPTKVTPTKVTPTKVTATPVPTLTGGLVNVSFCRNYDTKTKNVTFTYALQNTSSAAIPVELASTLAIEGQSKTVAVRYTDCISGGKSCKSRISGGKFSLKANETAEFSGEATLSAKPSKTNFYIKTSLRYDFNGKKLIPFSIGSASSACSVQPTATPTATPTKVTPTKVTPTKVTATPIPTLTGGLVNVSFCRNYDSKTKKVTFTYELKNTSSVTIPVELASTLAIEGQSKTAAVRYTDCISGGKSCKTRINKGFFNLKANETAAFSGEAALPSKPSKTNFYIKTSLRYNFNGKTLIPFSIGSTSSGCTAQPTAAPTVTPTKTTPTAAPAEKGGLENVSFCRTYDTKTKKVTFSYAIRNTSAVTIPVELATTLAVEGQSRTVAIRYTDCASGGSSCKARINKGFLNVKAKETVVLSGEAALAAKPSKTNFYVRTSLRYNFNGKTLIPFAIGSTTKTCAVAHAVSPEDTVMKAYEGNETAPAGAETDHPAAESSGSLTALYQIDTPRIPDKLPATGFSSRRPVRLSVQPETLRYRSLNGLHLDIPAINASADIVQVPLNENGEWAVEWLGSSAGILENSPLPGQGTAVIAAHNHLNNTEVGPFIAISQLETDSRIFVTDEKGSLRSYKVYENLLLSPDDGSRIYETAHPGSIVLLTCESEMQEGGYAFRRAVFAEPLQ